MAQAGFEGRSTIQHGDLWLVGPTRQASRVNEDPFPSLTKWAVNDMQLDPSTMRCVHNPSARSRTLRGLRTRFAAISAFRDGATWLAGLSGMAQPGHTGGVWAGLRCRVKDGCVAQVMRRGEPSLQPPTATPKMRRGLAAGSRHVGRVWLHEPCGVAVDLDRHDKAAQTLPGKRLAIGNGCGLCLPRSAWRHSWGSRSLGRRTATAATAGTSMRTNDRCVRATNATAAPI